MKKISNAQALRRVQDDLRHNYDPNKKLVTICAGTGCRGYGCIKVKEELEAEIARQKMDVEVRATGCFGFCEKGPLVVVHPEKIFYQQVKIKDVPDIISKTVATGEVLEKLLYRDPQSNETVMREEDVPFYKKQHRLVFGSNGMIDPTRIEDYLIIGGYTYTIHANDTSDNWVSLGPGTFTIVDTLPPQFTQCPPDETIQCDAAPSGVAIRCAGAKKGANRGSARACR